jgi:hypothetical protein
MEIGNLALTFFSGLLALMPTSKVPDMETNWVVKWTEPNQKNLIGLTFLGGLLAQFQMWASKLPDVETKKCGTSTEPNLYIREKMNGRHFHFAFVQWLSLELWKNLWKSAEKQRVKRSNSRFDGFWIIKAASCAGAKAQKTSVLGGYLVWWVRTTRSTEQKLNQNGVWFFGTRIRTGNF